MPHISWVAVPLSVKCIFKCRPVLVSLAILQVWVKVINEVIVRVVQPVVKKAWTVVHAFLWWRHHTRLYQDWTDVFQDLKNAFSDPDPEFFAQRKLIGLCQANRTFAEYYTEFSKYAEHSEFNDKALKCHLRCVILEEFSCQLVSINFEDLSYLQLVQECQTQDNQLQAAVTNVRKIMPRSQLPTKPNQTRILSVVQSTVPFNLPKPAISDANAMDLTRSKLTVQERERCHTQGLCFYCDLPGHITSSCPFKPSGRHIRTIQEASTA